MAVLARCLLIAEEAGDVVTQAEARHQLSLVCLAGAHHERAISHARQALAILEPTGRALMIARALATLGDAHEAAGERAEARSCHDRALRLFQQMRVPEAGPLAGRLGLGRQIAAEGADGPARSGSLFPNGLGPAHRTGDCWRGLR